MAKTRSKPPKTTPSLQSLPPPIDTPPQLVVLPTNSSPEARIISLNNTRYFIDPPQGTFYQFTHISPPKSTPKSWLLSASDPENTTAAASYILSAPSLLLATPVDPLFLLLPLLTSHVTSASTEYLALSDYLSRLPPSLLHNPGKLVAILESRIEAVSDTMSIGDDEILYAFSLPKLFAEILQKARRMAAKPLPKSMEERFVKGVLEVPVWSIRREEEEEEGKGGVSEQHSTSRPAESQESTSSATTTTTASVQTAATSNTTVPSQTEENKDCEITPLLRLRTCLDFLLRSYIPTPLHPHLSPLIDTSIDWSPLTTHLAHVANLRKETQALRSIGENISRKRARGEEDDEEEEGEGRRDEMRKKSKEEEVKARRSASSQALRKLEKVDRSGMRSLKSFFVKK